MAKHPARILFTIPNFITAGSGHAMLSIIERLDKSRFEPCICVLKTGGRLETRIRELDIPLLELPFTIPIRPVSTLLPRSANISRKFRPYRFDLWHSFHYSDDFSEPLIARFSGARYWIFTKKNMGWGSHPWKMRARLASRIAAQNTTMLEQFFVTESMQAKTRLIPRGVETGKFLPDIPPRLRLREQYAIPAGAFVIGCVAQLVLVKGHPTLLEAFARLPESSHLLLAGKPLDEVYTAELHAQADSLGIKDRVHFLGDVQDVPALHAELDAFVLPTLGKMRMEGCPVALLEALSCGVPSIATNIPGSKDIIEHEISGLLVPPEDPSALAISLRRLMEDYALRRQLGENGRKRVLAKYTIEREVADHEALYAELLRL
jgi:glycosyltransferase involved in cell wall biosynthesis